MDWIVIIQSALGSFIGGLGLAILLALVNLFFRLFSKASLWTRFKKGFSQTVYVQGNASYYPTSMLAHFMEGSKQTVYEGVKMEPSKGCRYPDCQVEKMKKRE